MLRESRPDLELDPRFEEVVAQIRNGMFGWEEFFAPILSNIESEDYYLVATDFPDYIAIQVCMTLSMYPCGPYTCITAQVRAPHADPALSRTLMLVSFETSLIS
jgi:hypothetical protein